MQELPQLVLERRIKVRVDGGLHARPIAEVVKLTRGFDATLTLCANGQEAPARSSMKLLLLGIKEGCEATVRAEGEDAEAALEAVCGYLGKGADAFVPRPAVPVATDPRTDSAVPVGVAPGIALAPVFAFRQPLPDPEPDWVAPDMRASQKDRVRAARDAVLARLTSEGTVAASPATKEVLAALAEMAADPDWLDAVLRAVDGGQGALAAVLDQAKTTAQAVAALDDPYARARAEDMQAVGNLVALALQGKAPVAVSDVPDGAVLVADELTAAHIGGADLSRLGGIVTATGAANGHAGILARSFAVPAVFGFGERITDIMAATQIALDGSTAEVIPDPAPEEVAAFRARLDKQQADARALAAFVGTRPCLADGSEISVAANIAGLADLEAARAVGAMGVGLMRTEFLFLDRPLLPDEEEQFSVYRQVLEQMGQHDPVVIRTLDIGGDKPARAIAVQPEENPFLGLRGIRLCLAQPDIFRPQIRALLRAAVYGHLDVMLPMVVDPVEIHATRALIDECRADLAREGVACGDFDLGIMIETPAAVLNAEELARAAAFFSIGTNDLTQYVMAADRMNPAVADLCRADHPSVQRAIRMTCEAGRAAGIAVGVCGEAAADPALVASLLRAGVKKLSMSPPSILKVKRLISDLSSEA